MPFFRLRSCPAVVVAALLFGLAFAWAQTPATPVRAPFEFDVVSVKPAAPDWRGGIVIGPDPGYQTYTVRYAPLFAVMMSAYQVEPQQISGGPGWINSDRWNITAKSNYPGTEDQLRVALQHVLEDRFQLKLHQETRQESVYDLVVEPGGAKLTPHQPPHDANMTPMIDVVGAKSTGFLTFHVRNVEMSYFAYYLPHFVNRRVIDTTELTAHYDFDFHFPFQPGVRQGGGWAAPRPPLQTPHPTAPSSALCGSSLACTWKTPRGL